MTDEILEEVRKAREAYGERFNFDLEAIGRDLREQQLASGREYVSLPPKRTIPTVEVPATDQAEVGSTETSTAARES